MGAPRIAVAVVTMGNRPDEVDALLESVAKQDVPPERIVIVGNGCPLPDFARRLSLPGEVTAVELDENLGCPGGRNAALARLREFGDIDVVVDLDDDGLLVDADVLRRVRDLYAADERLGIVGFRIADELGETQQRHVPRIGNWILSAAVTSPASSAAGTRCGWRCSTRPATGPPSSSSRTRRPTSHGVPWMPGGGSCTRRSCCSGIRRPRPPGTPSTSG